jgi:hypothetical protein
MLNSKFPGVNSEYKSSQIISVKKIFRLSGVDCSLKGNFFNRLLIIRTQILNFTTTTGLQGNPL